MTTEASERTVQAGPGVLRSAGIGAILAIDSIGHCIALATICFAATLPAGLGPATAAMLLATALTTLMLTLRSGFPVVVAIAQDTPVAILAPAVAMAAISAQGPQEAQVVTAMAVIGVSALLSGVVFWVVGRLGLGRVVRLFPYPVAAGFLAASGGILVVAAIRILTGAEGYADMVTGLSEPAVQANLACGLAFGLSLHLWQKVRPGPSPVLLAIFISFVAFYLALPLLGLDMATATNLGLLPQLGIDTGGFSLSPAMLTQIDWPVVARTAPTLAAVALIGLLGLLLNITGVELAAKRDVDSSHELRISGLANMVNGLFGGLTCYVQGGATVLANRLGVQGRPLALAYIAITLLACVFATAIVSAVPVFVAAGLLLFIGLSMIEDWLFHTWPRLMAADRVQVLVIMVIALTIGVLPAIAFGLALAVLSFAIGYARLPVVRELADGVRYRSVVDRSPPEMEVLQRDGARIRILHLQGALFFGSVDQMISQLSDLARSDRQRSQAIILNFDHVQSVDSAACAGLGKLGHLFSRNGSTVHLVNVAPDFRAIFNRWGLELAQGQAANGADLHLWPTLDDCLQHCEDVLLDQTLGASRHQVIGQLLVNLAGPDDSADDIAALVARLEPVALADGETLIRAGELSEDIYVLETGRLGVFLTAADTESARRVRVRVMVPGAVVGEVAHLLGRARTADVVSEGPSQVWRMSGAALTALAAEDANRWARWNAILARALAHKVVQTNLQLSRPPVRR
jgi:SulP family sulfate permease